SCGLDVLVAAPSWDASGSSAAVTAVESNGRPVCREVQLPGLEAPALVAAGIASYTPIRSVTEDRDAPSGQAHPRI
ncbi:MAG TPA: hypothetical protein VFW24_14080, partial [Acidimicrobiales bacterium]|nr:hypothetical protein [Acidimicrobiales bacterium]